MSVLRRLGHFEVSTLTVALGSAAIPSEYVEAGNATLTTRTFIGPPSINNCAALGDSFSAGPGAGNIIDGNTKCARSSLSYPEYLKNSTLLGLNRNQFSFQSCTGDVTTDVRANQVQALNSGTTFITLSVGGNDITFSSILLKCIFNLPGNCQNAIDNGRSILYGTDFFNNYYGLIQRILTNMGVKTGLADAGTRIIQTGYPGFFNEITDQCDTVSFALIGDNSLTKAFRAQFNQLGGELNAYLAWVLDTFSDDLYGQPLPFVSRGSFIDQGLSYRSHRFCERNVIEPDRQNTNTWVYNLGSNSGDTFTAANVTGINTAACEQQAGQDQAALFNCLLAIAYQQNPGLHLNYAPDTTPLNYVKTFRPTPGGHAATSDEILFQLTTNTATITGQTLRIMCMGDSLTAGFRSSDNNGYRSTVFNYLTGFRPANDVQMVGGVIVGSPPYDHSEGHSGYTIDQLMESIQASNIVAQTKPNVVLLMIGTNDVGKHTYPIADAYGKLTGLINYIFLNSERTAVILAQIPPIGLQPGAPGPPSAQQQLVIQYNAIVARVANSFQDAGRNVYLLHTTTTMNDHFPTDPLHLGDYGYKKLGFDFAKAILTINELGWIRIPEAATGTSTTTAAACSNKPNLIPNGQVSRMSRKISIKTLNPLLDSQWRRTWRKSIPGYNLFRFVCAECSHSTWSLLTEINNRPTGEPQCHCGNSDGSGVDFVVPLTGSSCADMSYYLVNAVHFADINGDGLQDFLWVDADGKVTAFINGGPMDPTKTLDLAQVNWYPAGVVSFSLLPFHAASSLA